MACCSLNQVGRIFQWREKREFWWPGPGLAFSFAAHQSPTPSSDVSSSHCHVVLLRRASPHRPLPLLSLPQAQVAPCPPPQQFLVSQGTMNHFLPVLWSCLDPGCDLCWDVVCSSFPWVRDPPLPHQGAWKARATLG